MSNLFSCQDSDVLGKDPLDLVAYLRAEVNVNVPSSLETKEDQRKAVQAMNELTAYICYFKEHETIARTLKRSAKTEKDREKADHYLGVEEVFEAYKRICEQQYECISKMVTMRRLDLEEAKILGKTT